MTDHDIDTPSAAARRSKVAAQRAAQRKAATRRRLFLVGAALVAVLAVFAGIVVLGMQHRSAATATAAGRASSALVAQLQVPVSVLDKAGLPGSVGAAPSPLAAAPALTADGKPQVLYVGANYCPFCAAQRWPLIVALSRFGSFSGLSTVSSSPVDVFPNTPTFSFHGATYTSDYLSFAGVETQTTTHAPLDRLTDAQSRLLGIYDAAPYVPSPGAIPFVMFGNKYVMQGGGYSPQLLAGKTQAQIAATLADPHSKLGQTIDGNANVVTAALCTLTGGRPGSVCADPVITHIQEALDAQAKH